MIELEPYTTCHLCTNFKDDSNCDLCRWPMNEDPTDWEPVPNFGLAAYTIYTKFINEIPKYKEEK